MHPTPINENGAVLRRLVLNVEVDRGRVLRDVDRGGLPEGLEVVGDHGGVGRIRNCQPLTQIFAAFIALD